MRHHEALLQLREVSPYVTIDDPGPAYLPTGTLRDPGTFRPLMDLTALRISASEQRVAASTLFFGYVARLWSVALGTAVLAGAPVSLRPDRLLWAWQSDALRLAMDDPRPGSTVAAEVIDTHVEPLVRAWSSVVAPGALWGNAAAALIGARRVLEAHLETEDQRRHVAAEVAAARAHPDIATRIDDETGRRRSCCLYYRTPTGGFCGDCPLDTPRQRTITSR